jgi:diguanylate cyclase (GGDEF)-like protein
LDYTPKGRFVSHQNKIRFYIALFIVFVTIDTVVNYYIYYEKRKSYIEEKLKEFSVEYETVLNELKKKGDIYFDEVVNRNSVLSILKDIDDKEKWEEIRAELIKELSPAFKRMKEKNVRQFHFHTKDIKSFLRMHSTERYGDSLNAVRYSVVATNRTLKSYHGFEEGRIHNGFRNVYPLLYNGKHLGSVEISFSFKEVSDALKRENSSLTFLISKQHVDSRVFSVEGNYITSSVNKNFYIERSDINWRILENREMFQKAENISEKIKDGVAERLMKRETFSSTVESDGKTYLAHFLAIKNIDGYPVAYIVKYSEDLSISTEFNKFLLYTLLSAILIFIFIYVIISHVKQEEFEFINEILDNQSSLILVKNQDDIVKVNKKLLDFFGYSTLQELKEYNDCICDFFIQEEGYLSKDFQDNDYIIQYVLNNPDIQHKVKIVEQTTKMVRVFSLNVAHLNEQDLYLLILSDITSSELERREIEDRASRDKLTNRYNRAKFDLDIKESVLKNRTFSLILGDIDNFKDVNDTYGHLTGDKILIEFGNLLDLRVRRSDIVYRWGGEEFVILVEDRMLGATKLAEKLRVLVENHRFFKDTPITASFGVTEHRKFESVDDIVARTDKALYTAKLSGRNCVVTC